MNVKELMEELQKMPPGAEVVTGKSVEGAWTVIGKGAQLTRYGKLKVCVLKEGY